MTHSPLERLRWSTTSFGDSVHTSAPELQALSEHLSLCGALRGRWFSLRCGAEAMNGFVAARFVTTLVLLALMLGASWMAW